MKTVQIPEPTLDTRWMADAACARFWGMPWTESGRIPALMVELMAETCAACPVRDACEWFVQDAEITAGWWAGASRNDRHLGDYAPSAPHAHPDAA